MKFLEGLHSVLQKDFLHARATAGRRVLQTIQFLELFLEMENERVVGSLPLSMVTKANR